MSPDPLATARGTVSVFNPNFNKGNPPWPRGVVVAMSEAAERVPTRAEAQPADLWRNRDFLRLWVGMNVSLLGTHVTALALPLVAVLTLQATPGQMGLLRATASASAALVGPFAGVLADRLRRRPIIVGADLGMAFLAFSIPAASALGLLRLEYLYAVQFLSGALSILGEVAMMAYLPSVVRRAQLVEANSKVQVAGSAITIAGPGLAGVLVQLLTAPVAILVDACSFILSALCVGLTRAPESDAPPASERRGLRAEIAEGLRVVYGHGVLRPLAEAIALHFLFAGMVYALIVLYAVRELGLAPAELGLVMAGLGPGFLVGALLAPRAARRYGVGAVLVYAPLLIAAGQSLIPLAAGPRGLVVATLAAAHMLTACGIQLHGVNLMALRQAITPHRLQGRVNASFRFVNLFAGGLGALAAGWAGGRLGLRATLAVAACGLLLPFARLLLSPVRRLRRIPDEEQP
jgi:MFS family permease